MCGIPVITPAPSPQFSSLPTAPLCFILSSTISASDKTYKKVSVINSFVHAIGLHAAQFGNNNMYTVLDENSEGYQNWMRTQEVGVRFGSKRNFIIPILMSHWTSCTVQTYNQLENAGLEIKKNVWSQFATSCENLVATLKILVAN